MSAETITVYETCLNDSGTGCISTDTEVILSEIAAFAEELHPGDTLNYTIKKLQMTRAEFDALPDFEGY